MIELRDLSGYVKEALALYNKYVLESTATFHTEPLSEAEFTKMAVKQGPVYESRAVIYNGVFAGYAYYGPFAERQAYQRTAEISIYLKDEFRGIGLGKTVAQMLEKRAASKGIKKMAARICAENEGSVRLFESMGYEKEGFLKDVGEKFGRLLSVAIFIKDI